MKKIIIAIAALLLVIGFNSCSGLLGGDEEGFSETYLYGEWRDGTLHEKYGIGGVGKTWDEKDDTTEDEATEFRWELNGDQLIQNHILWNGSVVPRIYTVTTLNALFLVYEDNYGKTYSFTRF